MNKKNPQSFLGPAAVLLSTVLWGCIGIFSRNLLGRGFSSVQIVAWRAVTTSSLVGLYMLLFHRELFRIRLRDIWIFLGMGIASFLFFNICYMTSMEENSLSVACILMYTSPIWVTLLSAPLFHEKLTGKKLLCLFLCFGGCVLVCLSGSILLTRKGLVCGILSGIGYAAYSLFGKPATRKYSSVTILFYTFLFAALGALPICHISDYPALLAQEGSLLYCFGITLTNTLLPYLLYTYGLGKLDAGTASVLSILEPVVASFVGVIAFDEHIGLLGAIGIALVAAGLAWLSVGGKQKGKAEK